MNDITAVFLCELAVEGHRQDLLQLLHQELKKDFDIQHHALAAKMFAAASEPALQLQEQAEQLRNQVDQIDSLQALSDFQRETERLAGAWEALRGQTCEELHRVPPALENLHFLSGEELEKLRPALCRIINIHLYRLLTLGGMRAIQGLALPPVSQALKLLRYYWEEIVPAEQHVPPERWRMQWAVRFDPDAALGRMLRMPSYQLQSPDLSQREILPGQYITWTLAGTVIVLSIIITAFIPRHEQSSQSEIKQQVQDAVAIDPNTIAPDFGTAQPTESTESSEAAPAATSETPSETK